MSPFKVHPKKKKNYVPFQNYDSRVPIHVWSCPLLPLLPPWDNQQKEHPSHKNKTCLLHKRRGGRKEKIIIKGNGRFKVQNDGWWFLKTNMHCHELLLFQAHGTFCICSLSAPQLWSMDMLPWALYAYLFGYKNFGIQKKKIVRDFGWEINNPVHNFHPKFYLYLVLLTIINPINIFLTKFYQYYNTLTIIHNHVKKFSFHRLLHPTIS